MDNNDIKSQNDTSTDSNIQDQDANFIQPQVIAPSDLNMQATPQATASQQQPTPQPTPELFQQSANSVHKIPKSSSGKGKKIALMFLFIVMLGGLGFLGYTYKTTNDTLRSQSNKLSDAYSDIKKLNAGTDFIAKYNDAALSRASCPGNGALLMSDVHVNDKYAVYRYLCANSTYPIPIRIGAFEKFEDGTFKFTYGDGTAKTNQLPSYIYDSEPEFFSTYGVTRF